jgi:NAD(P)-dependent dehydrogenase (short-subunit alcohol dehydrogenase family)
MELDLSGRVAVVTGASKGIGLAIAQTLRKEGARVVAASRTLTPELDALDVLHVAADLMEPAAPAAVIARAVDELGGLDVLVNNAGGPPPGDHLPHDGFLSRTDENWRAIVELNLLAAVRACRAALPHLIERGGGAIVNVSSGSGYQPTPVTVEYGTAKAAMLNLTKAI